jgi:hypothetical protein
MLMVNSVMADAFEMGQGFQKIWNQRHIISNFQQIKGMLMVNSVMASVFEMGEEFQEI